MGGKGKPAATVLRRKVYAGGSHRPGAGVRRHRPDQGAPGRGPWRGTRQRCAGSGTGAELSGAAAGGGTGQAAPAGRRGAAAPCGMERDFGRDPCAAHGRGAAGSAAQFAGRALWPERGVRPRRHSVQGDHHGAYGGRGPLRAAAPLCGGACQAGAPAPRQRDAVCRRLPGRSAGQELAAPCADPSGRKAAPWRADRCAADGREDHPHCGPRPSQTHGGRRFPAGHLSRGAAGPDAGQKPAAGAMVCLSAGSAGGEPWPCYDRYPAHGGQL